MMTDLGMYATIDLNAFDTINDGITVQDAIEMNRRHPIAEFPMSGDMLKAATTPKRRKTFKRLTFAGLDDTAVRSLAKHMAIRDTAAGINRLTGIAQVR